ncbi:hypothetical protein OESDEN_07873 [Oesophagostomum dentatum]|uniref:Uncharacterized protein n=1 Tax=Oesophagostomum dentatum TaxID=61180 RepID=A0A0B1T3W5_OESDE|nr:hypothetical protein OESDEN_07873 [Oesophagostomum dentatum]
MLGTGLTDLIASIGSGVQPMSCCTCCTPVKVIQVQPQPLPPVTTAAPAPAPQPIIAQPIAACCPCPPQQQGQGPKNIVIHLPPPPPTTRRPTNIYIHMPPPVVPMPPIPPFILTRPGMFGTSGSGTTAPPIGIPDVVTGECGQVIVPLYNPPTSATSLGKK